MSKTMIYLEDLKDSLRDDPEIPGRVFARVMKHLDNAPAVNAEPVKHGRWLYDSGSEKYFCSECNENAVSSRRDEPVYDYDWEENLRYSHTETIIEEHLTDYCSHCGAKMYGGNEQ